MAIRQPISSLATLFSRKWRIIPLFVIHYQRAIHVRSEEKILRPRDPLDMRDCRWIDHTVLVDASIFLGHGLVPEYISSGRTHHQIKVRGSFCEVVNVVAQHVRLREQYLRQMLLFRS